MFGDHALGGLLEEGAHEKSPKCLGGNLGDFGEFCKGLRPSENQLIKKENRISINWESGLLYFQLRASFLHLRGRIGPAMVRYI